MNKSLMWMWVAILSCGLVMVSCSDDDNNSSSGREETVVIDCVKPDYLKVGDKVALISPSYFTPMENVEKTADVLRSWGLEPVVVPNVGSQADATKGKDLILFVEEVGESMHNIDRQMRILQMNGVLDRCKGVVLGEFTDCGSEFTYESVEAMLHELLVKYDIPVLCGFPAGHDDVNLPLVMGAPVTIDVRNDGVTLQFDIEGVQREVNTADITAAQTPAAVRMRLAGKRE